MISLLLHCGTAVWAEIFDVNHLKKYRQILGNLGFACLNFVYLTEKVQYVNMKVCILPVCLFSGPCGGGDW